MFTKAVESKTFAGGIEFPIGPNLRVPVIGRPFGDIGVETFAVLNDRGEQEEIAALAQFGLQTASQFIPSLGFDRYFAVGTKLRA